MFFFFFSSRRRHTRLQGDWSSDVCSSDLRPGPVMTQPAVERPSNSEVQPPGVVSDPAAGAASTSTSPIAASAFIGLRSEERRVGKECSSRRWPDKAKKKK